MNKRGVKTAKFKARIAQVIILTIGMALFSLTVLAKDAITVVDDYLKAWNAQDAIAAVGMLTKGVRCYDLALGNTVKGSEQQK